MSKLLELLMAAHPANTEYYTQKGYEDGKNGVDRYEGQAKFLEAEGFTESTWTGAGRIAKERYEDGWFKGISEKK